MMRTSFLSGAAILLVLGSSGCVKEPRDELLKKNMVIVSEMTDMLCQINDEKSSKKFKPKLKILTDRFKLNDEELKKIDKPTEEEFDLLTKLFGEEIGNCNDRWTHELARLRRDKDLWAVVSDALPGGQLTLVIPEPKRETKPGDMMGPGGGGMKPPMGGRPN